MWFRLWCTMACLRVSRLSQDSRETQVTVSWVPCNSWEGLAFFVKFHVSGTVQGKSDQSQCSAWSGPLCFTTGKIRPSSMFCLVRSYVLHYRENQTKLNILFIITFDRSNRFHSYIQIKLILKLRSCSRQAMKYHVHFVFKSCKNYLPKS